MNHHAGDDGLLGDEENDEIIPADIVFLRLEKENYNCLLGMYHDQAQIGLKTISGGLPIVITTCVHSTAFDIKTIHNLQHRLSYSRPLPVLLQ